MNSFVNALQSHIPCPDRADRPGDKPARRDATDGRGLLDRILDTPHLAQVVPRLQPELLHRVIQTCGLEDCGELVALATPEQLARIFDLDLWRAAQARPGRAVRRRSFRRVARSAGGIRRRRRGAEARGDGRRSRDRRARTARARLRPRGGYAL